jgi:soluble lytic murein transglycosylase-like protein
MYERYGNWPDALAGYNWGPGSTDSWIAAGRPEQKLPLETARYIEMVLRDAVIGKVRL